jgi:hypothetical protein
MLRNGGKAKWVTGQAKENANSRNPRGLNVKTQGEPSAVGNTMEPVFTQGKNDGPLGK